MIAISVKQIFFLDGENGSSWLSSDSSKKSNFKFIFFSSQTECFDQLQTQRCDLLIADLSSPKTYPVDVLREIQRMVPWVPVLTITGNGDIPKAVEAIKAGAVDVLEKPFEKKDFVKKVKSILKEYSATPEACLGKTLSEKEFEVLRFILEGKSNKEIACTLHRSIRTIEVHRRHTMHKLGASNVIDLVKRTASMKLDNTAENPRIRQS